MVLDSDHGEVIFLCAVSTALFAVVTGSRNPGRSDVFGRKRNFPVLSAAPIVAPASISARSDTPSSFRVFPKHLVLIPTSTKRLERSAALNWIVMVFCS